MNKKELIKKLIEQDISNESDLLELLIDTPVSKDVDNEINQKELFVDKVTSFIGSWKFIISFLLFLFIWIICNLFLKLDSYPFILLNLVLSMVAAIQAPIIMMSQNRKADIDSKRSQNDYKVDLKSELILEDLHDNMTSILKNQKEILEKLNNNE
ncbi:MAG: DUF1003 domain-containing protein [Mycoplasmatota bacterium]